MAENYFTINLLQLCKTELKDISNLDNFINRITNLKLTPSEEEFITVIFPPDVDNFEVSLENYEKLISIVRGQDGVDDYWLSNAQLSKVAFNRELLEDAWFFNKIMRSIFVYREHYFPELAVRLANIYFDFVGDNWVPEIKAPFDFYYLRLFLLLLEKYFGRIREEWQLFFLKSKWLSYYVSIGLDLDKIMSDAVLYFNFVEDRREFSLILAVALLSNTTPIGNDEKGNAVYFGYWLEKFQNYYQKDISGLKMTNFLAEDSYWTTSTLDEKEIVKQLLFVYNNLISDFYVLKDINEKDIEKYSKIKKIIINNKKIDYIELKNNFDVRYAKDTDGQFVDLDEVLNELHILSDQHNDQKIKDLYFFDDQENKFKWSI